MVFGCYLYIWLACLRLEGRRSDCFKYAILGVVLNVVKSPYGGSLLCGFVNYFVYHNKDFSCESNPLRLVGFIAFPSINKAAISKGK
jgi:hypothetical protein